MLKISKTTFQDIHYLRTKPNFVLNGALGFMEFFYKTAINFKNFLYEKNILKEFKTGIEVICVGNLTTGGVGKTPIVRLLANELSKEKKVAIISRGYGAKLSNKIPRVIKDSKGLKFKDGRLCGDEPFQLANNVENDVIVITSRDRRKAIEYALVKYGIDVAILDDGFSNRKVKKDKNIIVIDSKMRFGNNHLLPKGPLREPVEEIKRADEIIIVDKSDKKLDEAILWAKKFNKPMKICEMRPKRIYNMQTGAVVLKKEKAIAFCAIGQPYQFFNFLKEDYELVSEIPFSDHHKYSKIDIMELISVAKEKGVNTFITTQKDETKLKELIQDNEKFSFNVLELETVLTEV